MFTLLFQFYRKKKNLLAIQSFQQKKINSNHTLPHDFGCPMSQSYSFKLRKTFKKFIRNSI